MAREWDKHDVYDTIGTIVLAGILILAAYGGIIGCCNLYSWTHKKELSPDTAKLVHSIQSADGWKITWSRRFHESIITNESSNLAVAPNGIVFQLDKIDDGSYGLMCFNDDAQEFKNAFAIATRRLVINDLNNGANIVVAKESK